MKISIIINDDAGREYRGEAVLNPSAEGQVWNQNPVAEETKTSPSRVRAEADFELPVRAFVKKYVPEKTGSQKFALLLARLTKGNTSTTVAGADLQKEWNSMTALMGGKYNTAYPTRAKERGWIDSPKSGSFILRPGWTEALEENGG